MTITERTAGNVRILDVSGSITIGPAGTELLADKVRSLLQQGQRQLIVNLANVAYMDSAGLGELVHAYATTARQGGSMKLVNATVRLRDLLTITKLATVFDLYDSETAAIASFAPGV